MHALYATSNFVEAFKFIGRDGSVPGIPGLPTLVHLTLETLKVAAIGIGISLVIALPLGVWLGHIHRGSFIAINVGNVWRSLPSLAILAIGVALYHVGLTIVEIALVVLAVPPMITNAYVAINGIDPEIVDAARGMGFTGWQILRRVELPMGIPLIFAGIRTASLFVVSTTTIASLAGFPGTLGDIVNDEASYHLYGVIGAGILIAALALAIEIVLAATQRAITPRGLILAARQDRDEELDPAVLDPAVA